MVSPSITEATPCRSSPVVSLEQAGRVQARTRVKAVRAEFIGGLAGFIPA
jgi:hypothetical protein